MTNRLTQSDSEKWIIGLIGYGEVGRILAEDLSQQGFSLLAYDIKLKTDLKSEFQQHAHQYGVELTDSTDELAARADLIISAVTANQTVPVVEQCAGKFQEGAFFLDLNSASPGTKQKAAELVEKNGGYYVEGAVMTSVPPYRLKVPLLLGGPHGEVLNPFLKTMGFSSEVGSNKLGTVSAVKMCRSVMIKGLEAMMIESLTTARAYGVEDQVLASLKETFPGLDWEQQGSYFFQRVIEHGRRRAEEVREVAKTVQEIGLTPYSAAGTADRQAWIADLADGGVFGERNTADFARSPDWRTEADRILQFLKEN
ncbi:tartronate semialdehyde reductase [Oligella ureolytica]|uniref:NAD(P)-dependent oxidoreductase n=1 Tax=Oligella ureolytica TaxID=90244 RepID=A0A378XHT2_9BURK|nr:NAD(P)-dependent oxidoreductase [Oligella ureolytica]QPT39193.1 NAD(P)-dependent oxidoreductase [Oligella ureolytica]SUA55189.1 tartronate semialdehyde reductase [Oligella ureolytica]SUA56406.1 tartronate semialdehyde reductase [Oligella ureolytica]